MLDTNEFYAGEKDFSPSNPHGELAERPIAEVLKTSEGNTSVGSNPTLASFSVQILAGLAKWQTQET